MQSAGANGGFLAQPSPNRGFMFEFWLGRSGFVWNKDTLNPGLKHHFPHQNLIFYEYLQSLKPHFPYTNCHLEGTVQAPAPNKVLPAVQPQQAKGFNFQPIPRPEETFSGTKWGCNGDCVGLNQLKWWFNETQPEKNMWGDNKWDARHKHGTMWAPLWLGLWDQGRVTRGHIGWFDGRFDVRHFSTRGEVLANFTLR
jgi:hypothetical protein